MAEGTDVVAGGLRGSRGGLRNLPPKPPSIAGVLRDSTSNNILEALVELSRTQIGQLLFPPASVVTLYTILSV